MSSISATVASSRHPGLAALSLCSGVAIFSGQDWIIKLLSGDYPVHQAIAIRGVVAVLILLAFIAYSGKIESLRSKRMGLLIVRGLVLMMAYTTYYLAFPSMPLASIVAIWFTVPLFVTALAGPFLGEKVGVRRWIAAIVGFVGVLIIVRPGTDSFDARIAAAGRFGADLFDLRADGAAHGRDRERAGDVVLPEPGLSAGRAGDGGDLRRRRLRGHHRPQPRLPGARLGRRPSLLDLGLLAACGVIASIATVLLTQAYRMAEANFVACFEYTAIIWAIFGGYVFFGETLDAYSVAGAALIVVAGLYVLFRTQPASPLETEKV